MDRLLPYSLQQLPYVVITLLIAFTIHEFAHAWVAYQFGDKTVKNRLTFNPIEHIDPLGAIMILIAGFGWAKPVSINPYYFKKRRLGSILVSFAGPFSNLILVTLGVFAQIIFAKTNSEPNFISEFLWIFIGLNAMLFVFNLLPFPPLDGYHIVREFLPIQTRAWLSQYEMYGIIIFVLLVVTPLSKFTITPIFNYLIPGILSVIVKVAIAIFG